MENKNSFILYKDLIYTVKKMTKEKAGELFLHILKYVNDENPNTKDIIIDLTFEPIKQSLKRDLIKWNDIREKRSDAGKISAIKKKQKATKSTSVKNVKENQQRATRSTVTVNVIDTVTDIVNATEQQTTNTPKKVEKEKNEKNIDKRKQIFFNQLSEYVETYNKKMIRDFYDYWSEQNKPCTKMRFELQKTWDLKKRLKRWANNDEKFNKYENTEVPDMDTN